jgi:hypothetical protein
MQAVAYGVPNAAANGREGSFPSRADIVATLVEVSRTSPPLFVGGNVFSSDALRTGVEKDRPERTACSTILCDGTSPRAHTIHSGW